MAAAAPRRHAGSRFPSLARRACVMLRRPPREGGRLVPMGLGSVVPTPQGPVANQEVSPSRPARLPLGPSAPKHESPRAHFDRRIRNPVLAPWCPGPRRLQLTPQTVDLGGESRSTAEPWAPEPSTRGEWLLAWVREVRRSAPAYRKSSQQPASLFTGVRVQNGGWEPQPIVGIDGHSDSVSALAQTSKKERLVRAAVPGLRPPRLLTPGTHQPAESCTL